MITSTKNERIKEISKLKQKKYRDETSLYLVEGYHLVEEAYNQGLLETLITTLSNYKLDVETIEVSENVMSYLSFTKSPQPVMGIVRKKKDVTLLENGHRYLLLDNIQDPGNLGTIIRTAYALGVDQLIISQDSVDLYNDKVIRSTQGGLFKLNILIDDLKEIIPVLQRKGIEVYASSLHHAINIKDVEKKEKMAFVMGNEGNGIKQEIIDICNGSLKIPMHNTESLNVAIATSIILWEFNN